MRTRLHQVLLKSTQVLGLSSLLTLAQPIFAPAVAVAAGPQCASIWWDRGDLRPVLLMIDDLIRLQIEIGELSDPRDKSLALLDLKQKSRDLQQIVGPRFRKLYEERLKQLAPRKEQIEAKKKEAQAKKAKVREQLDEMRVKWTRKRDHEGLENYGEFLNETEMFVQTENEIVLYDYKKREIVSREASPPELAGGKWGNMVLDPQKENLIVARPHQIGIKNLASRQWRWVDAPSARQYGYAGIKVSPDGKRLYLSGRGGDIKILRLPELTTIFSDVINNSSDGPGSSPEGQMIIESPDQRYVFFIKGNREHVLYDLVSEKPVPVPIHEAQDAVFSNDSKVLTIVESDGAIDYRLDQGRLEDSRFGNFSAEKIFVSADRRYLLVPEEDRVKVLAKPFSVFEMDSGREVPVNFQSEKFGGPYFHVVSGQHPHFAMLDHDRAGSNGMKVENRRLYFFNFDTLSLMRFEHPIEYGITMDHFSPDGESLFGTGDGNIIDIC